MWDIWSIKLRVHAHDPGKCVKKFCGSRAGLKLSMTGWLNVSGGARARAIKLFDRIRAAAAAPSVDRKLYIAQSTHSRPIYRIMFADNAHIYVAMMKRA